MPSRQERPFGPWTASPAGRCSNPLDAVAVVRVPLDLKPRRLLLAGATLLLASLSTSDPTLSASFLSFLFYFRKMSQSAAKGLEMANKPA